MNSNQFLTLLQKGNDLQKEDFQQLVKLHASFPYFQIPAVLAAKYENENSKDGSAELLHKAAILSPNRSWLRSLIENNIHFLEEKENEHTSGGSPSIVIIDSQKDPDISEALDEEEIVNIPSEKKAEEQEIEDDQTTASVGYENNSSDLSEEENINVGVNTNLSSQDSDDADTLDSNVADIPLKELNEKIKFPKEDMSIDDLPTLKLSEEKDNKDPIDIISPIQPEEDIDLSLNTSPSDGDQDTIPDLILPEFSEKSDFEDNKEQDTNLELVKPDEEDDKPIIEPVTKAPNSRQDILKQLEDNLAKLKSESNKNKPLEEDDDEQITSRPRRKRSGEDLIDSIKKKEKREIKDTKKKEQNDIIKAFNKKSIKMAAIKENEDVNKLQDLSLPSTKINDRMVSESYAKLLTQQGKKAAAKEIYKKLILKFPQKKAYFADLIQQLEE